MRRVVIITAALASILFAAEGDAVDPASIAQAQARANSAQVADVAFALEKISEINSTITRIEPIFNNPFYYPPRPVVAEDGTPVVPAPKEPTLQSVFGSRALINGEWKKAGESTIGGWRVQRVLVDSVILINGNSRRTLLLNSGVKKNNFIVKVGG